MSKTRCQCGAELIVEIEYYGRGGRCIQCGRVLRFIASLAPGRVADFSCRLIVESGPDRVGEQIFFSGPRALLIGKGDEQSVRLAGPGVSRQHCALIPLPGGGWGVEDRGSTNGTFVNRRRVESHALSHGDLLAIGNYSLRFRSQTLAVAPAFQFVTPMTVPTDSPSAPPSRAAAKSDPSDELGLLNLPNDDPPSEPSLADDLPQREPDDLYDFVEEPVVNQTKIAPPPRSLDGPICPGCRQATPRGSKICVQCGIDLKTGRLLVTSRGVDENILYHNVQTIVWWVSWLSPIGIAPIASEAYGRFKPYAIQAITVLTIFITAAVWYVNYTSHSWPYGAARNLMLWVGDHPDAALIKSIYLLPDAAGDAFRQKEAEIDRRENPPPPPATDPQLEAPSSQPTDSIASRRTAQQERLRLLLRQQLLKQNDVMRRQWQNFGPPSVYGGNAHAAAPQIPVYSNHTVLEAYNQLPPEFQKLGEFHPYQLLTYAFLHAGIGHLLGNMIFLVIFGNRVNALIGQWKSGLLYLVLAILSGGTFYLSRAGQPLNPMIGASGAIMGMAGMYFILMPVNRVHIVFWLRPVMLLIYAVPLFLVLRGFLGMLVLFISPVVYLLCRLGLISWIRTFSVRGYWTLLFFISFDVWATLSGSKDGTAHWAHLGGFICGAVIALALLLTRQVEANGADMISLILGPRAWTLLGAPAGRVSGENT